MISKDNSQDTTDNQNMLQRKVEKIILGNNDDDNDEDNNNDDDDDDGRLVPVYTNSQSTSKNEIVIRIIL